MINVTKSKLTTIKLGVEKGQTITRATIQNGEVSEISLSYFEQAKSRWSIPQYVPTEGHLQELLLAITELLAAIEDTKKDEQVTS